jgi:hypothetical protein
MPSLGAHVVEVLFSRAKEKMVDVHAIPNIAAVTHVESIGDRPEGKNPGKPVRVDFLRGT